MTEPTAPRTVIVTGAASGIGLATARRLAREGARVIGLDIQSPAEMVEGVAFHVVDVSDETSVTAVLGRTCLDGIDGLATFAGIERPGTLEETTEADWMECFRVNVLGTVNVARSALPGLRRKRGAIVLCSTQLSLSGGRDCVAYAASKGAINAFCRSLALDCAASGVRVNAIAPGAVETAMMGRVFSVLERDAIETARQRHPLGRFGQADEIAAVACHLLSSDASFVTGTVIPVDGGWTAA